MPIKLLVVILFLVVVGFALRHAPRAGRRRGDDGSWMGGDSTEHRDGSGHDAHHGDGGGHDGGDGGAGDGGGDGGGGD